jgi:hypothetical protein
MEASSFLRRSHPPTIGYAPWIAAKMWADDV